MDVLTSLALGFLVALAYMVGEYTGRKNEKKKYILRLLRIH